MKNSSTKILVAVMAIVMFCGFGCEIPENKQTVIVHGNPNEPEDQPPVEETWQAIYQESIMSVPKVEVEYCTFYGSGYEYCQLYSHGSGWIIADGIVATNYHVGEYMGYPPDLWDFPNSIGYYKVVVRYPATDSLTGNEFIDQKYQATGIYSLWNRDLVLLQVETLGRSPLPLSQESYGEIEILQEVMTMGYPQDFDFVASLGVINDKLTAGSIEVPWLDIDTNLLKISATTDGGNSGGPLLNKSGEVIGVNSLIYFGYTEHFVGISTDYYKGVNLENVEFFFREIPNPQDYTTSVFLDVDSELNPIDEEEVYTLDLDQECFYRFTTTANAPTGVSTYFELKLNGLTYLFVFGDEIGSEFVWDCWESATWTLHVGANTFYTPNPGWYNLYVEEYCPAP